MTTPDGPDGDDLDDDLAGGATHTMFLMDKSALARAHHLRVRGVLEPLAARARLATCTIIDLERCRYADGRGTARPSC